MITTNTMTHKDTMLAQIRARQAIAKAKSTSEAISLQVKMAHIPLAPVVQLQEAPESAPTEIVLNDQQLLAIDYALAGKEFCLIGAAGTGKTTTTRELIRRVREQMNANGESPDNAIVCIAFTRRAVRNIAKALAPIGAANICKTAHALLEYAPNREGYVREDGEWCETMRFIPQRTALNPITNAKLIIVDEASMLGYTSLYREVREACPNARFIFIGDLNQLPPVFGDAVLGYKLATLPVVELTQVYRQAMDSPIIWFQYNLLLLDSLLLRHRGSV